MAGGLRWWNVSETGYDLSDIYKQSIGGWRALLSGTEFGIAPFTEIDLSVSKRFQLLLHVDSVRRLNLYRSLLAAWPPSLESLHSLVRRMVEMLTFRLLLAEAAGGL